MVVDFQCRDHPDPIIPASTRCRGYINYFHTYVRMLVQLSRGDTSGQSSIADINEDLYKRICMTK